MKPVEDMTPEELRGELFERGYDLDVYHLGNVWDVLRSVVDLPSPVTFTFETRQGVTICVGKRHVHIGHEHLGVWMARWLLNELRVREQNA